MRLIALAALLLLLPLPASAQEEPTPLLEDDEGDVRVEVQGTAGPAVSAVYPAADLTSLVLIEGPQDFTWVLTVADLRPGNQETGADGSAYTIGFTHNRRQFQLEVFNTVPLVSGFPFASLASRDSPEAEWAYIWGDVRAVSVDLEADTVTVVLPREVLADADGAVPFPGRSIEAIHARGQSALSGGSISIGLAQEVPFPYTVVDVMPEAGEDLGSYAVRLGVLQTGDARLFSDTPFRASNGEATTYVFEVVAQNLGDEAAVMELLAVGVPSKLTVVLPVPLVVLEAEDEQVVPVLVTVPFGHDHGSASKFILELHSQDDPASVGRLEMGVRFLAVPQPAGHHDTVYLHSSPKSDLGTCFGCFENGYMNTLEDDPNDALRDVVAQGLSFSGEEYSYSWTYALGPALEMGLDVDLGRNGQYSIPMATKLPMLQTTFEATLVVQPDYYFFGPGFIDSDAIVIATVPRTAPIDIQANSKHVFEGELLPYVDGDQVPYEVGRNLYLHVQVTTAGPVPTTGFAEESAAIPPGGWMRLPVDEWHDQVDEALAAVDGPALYAVTQQERRVNPGEAVVYQVQVDNPTNRSMPMRFELSGSNLAWGSLPQDSLSVPAESIANFTVILRAPAESLDGERADLVLQAYPRSNPEARGLLRLVAIVDSTEDLPDDTAAADELDKRQESPSPSFVLVGLALLAIALGRRR